MRERERLLSKILRRTPRSLYPGGFESENDTFITEADNELNEAR